MLPPPPRMWTLGEYLVRVALPYGCGYSVGRLLRIVMGHAWTF